jgi:carbon storage regulator
MTKNKEVLMLKLTLKPGDFIDIGNEIKVVFSGGSSNNIHLLVDAPKELNIARSTAGKNKKSSPYYREKGISEEAKKEIASILMREKMKQ